MGVKLVRILGAATAAYSVAIMVRPVWLARPCGLTDDDGQVQESTATLIRAVGARDAAIGTAMVCARGPQALQAVSACRVAADLSDAVVFGTVLTGQQRVKVAGFAAGWGVLCAVAAAGLGRAGRRSKPASS
ncbi:hypothetical protein [Streptomyces sp. NPDC056405]|uniref:hypothetical protein n=1 Tax=Streptomyces sp. NPDC056405 TaxID=3345811 RepID=UPI0035DF63C4